MTQEYFATQSSDVLSAEIHKRVENFSAETLSSGLKARWRKSWRYYYNKYFSDAVGAFTMNSEDIRLLGDEGELTAMSVNNYRNLLQHLLVMTTQNRPAMEVRASNADSKSLVQARLGNAILDYYIREKRLEEVLQMACEQALVLGAGFVRIDWDVSAGEEYTAEIDEMGMPTGQKIMQGDLKYSNPSVYDLVFDTAKENWNDNNWIIQLSWHNKWDYVAQFPEHAEKIKALPTKNELYAQFRAQQVDSEDILVAEFFHKKTASVPNGRYMRSLASDLWLIDSELPFREIPIYRIVPGNIMGTQHGYSPAFDLAGLQEALNAVMSAQLTNINAFGVQNIAVPKGSDITIQSLTGGLNVVEYNPEYGAPEPLDLLKINDSTFKFGELLNQWMESLSGMNEAARGVAPGADMSAAAMSLLQSMAVQFNSGLQNSYARLIEDVGTGSLRILRDYAKTKRVIAITGKANQPQMKEFSGDDLDSINRVVVDVGNPLQRTTAGRMTLAQDLLNTGLINQPQQYINLVLTGQLEPMTENVQVQNELVQNENEALLEGRPVQALIIDNHVQHIRAHAAVIGSSEARMDQELVQRTLMHIQEHIVQMAQGDPNLLNVLGYQSLQMPPGPPPAQPPPEENPPKNVPPGANGKAGKPAA